MKHWKVSLGLITAFTAVAGASEAQIIAYNAPSTFVGNQQFTGSLGLDFNVVSSIGQINITSLGYFDSSTNGVLGQGITVALYDRTNPTTPIAIQTFTGTAGTLAAGSSFRFLTLTTPLTLSGGFQGRIVAYGFGFLDPNGNTDPSTGLPMEDNGSSINSGNPILTFTGLGEINNTPGLYPNTPDISGHLYEAGSFVYGAVVSRTPEPGALALLFGAGVPGSLLLRRRLRRNK